MFLEIHIFLIIPDEGQKMMPNLKKALKGYPGYHSFGEWKHVPERKCYECYAEFMDCFAGKYKNYFAKNDIYYRPATIGCESMRKRFRGGNEDITDPVCAAIYKILENKNGEGSKLWNEIFTDKNIESK